MKRINKLLSILICLLFALTLSASAFAAGADNLVVDDADILTFDEESELEKALVIASEEKQASIAVLTTTDFEGKDVVSFADDYYDYNGYGYGESADGCLLVVNMETRDWYITTTGRIIDELPSYVIDSIGESIVPYLSSGEYLDAFMTYGEMVDFSISFDGEYPEDDFVFAGDYGAVYDDYYDDFYTDGYTDGWVNADIHSGSQRIIAAIVIGIIFAFITVTVMKSQLKSVKISTEAREYMKADTLSVTKHSDRFLYKNVTRSAKPKNTSSSSHGGGGVHVGSSGRSHGGGGGRF